MSFWKTEFLAKRRKQWMDAIYKFQYQVNGSWYDARVNSKTISGNTVTFIVSLPTVPHTAHTITGVRLWDVTGVICAEQAVTVKRTASQGVLAKFEFPIYEKGDE